MIRELMLCSGLGEEMKGPLLSSVVRCEGILRKGIQGIVEYGSQALHHTTLDRAVYTSNYWYAIPLLINLSLGSHFDYSQGSQRDPYR